MPLYEYICNNDECETDTFEVITSFKETTEQCPSCKENSKDRKKFYQYHFTI
jgi:putative FmdB family regulatory protein